jgi:hypothetical protein
MSSVQSAFSQPKTRTLVVTQDESENERGPYVFKQQDVDNWLSNNSSELTTVGSLVVITGNFSNVLDNLSSSGRFKNRKSLLDLGKEVIIGSPIESRLVVLRKVRAEGDETLGGDDGNVAYIVTENYTNEGSDNSGRFAVRAARV